MILTIGIIIGDFVTINQNATIGHDCFIGKFSNVAPGSNLGGGVVIGEGCDIGIGATVRDKIRICNNVTLGLNCGVVKDIKESGVYVGTPARRIKSNAE